MSIIIILFIRTRCSVQFPMTFKINNTNRRHYYLRLLYFNHSCYENNTQSAQRKS